MRDCSAHTGTPGSYTARSVVCPGPTAHSSGARTPRTRRSRVHVAGRPDGLRPGALPGAAARMTLRVPGVPRGAHAPPRSGAAVVIRGLVGLTAPKGWGVVEVSRPRDVPSGAVVDGSRPRHCARRSRCGATCSHAPVRGRHATDDRNARGFRYHHPDRRGRAVQAADGSASSAWVRLLDPAGEFVAEVATSPDGEFRFDVLPGRWVLRALSPLGVTETPVEAEPGRTVEAELRLWNCSPNAWRSSRSPHSASATGATSSRTGRSRSPSTRSATWSGSPDVLGSAGLRLGLVVETHLHNDYVTGGLELSRRFRTGYAVPTGPRLGFDAVRVADGACWTPVSCGSG